jgi:hypothetical protein
VMLTGITLTCRKMRTCVARIPANRSVLRMRSKGNSKKVLFIPRFRRNFQSSARSNYAASRARYGRGHHSAISRTLNPLFSARKPNRVNQHLNRRLAHALAPVLSPLSL